jgi:hypothetical protein
LALPSNLLLYQDVVKFEQLTKQNGRDRMKTWNSGLSQGAGLMLIASLAFIGYAVVFFFRNFAGGGFELGVTTLNGVTPDNLDALNPAIMHYIKHLHLAISGFIAATAIAVWRIVLVWRTSRRVVGVDRRSGIGCCGARDCVAVSLARSL